MIVDLYAGAGGWSEGIRAAGLGPAVGLEIWADACRTAAAAGHLRVQADVAAYPTAPFAGHASGVVASPPCQPWSSAGKRLGEDDRDQVHELVDAYAAGSVRAWQDMPWSDDRSHHAAQPVRWLHALRPEWVAMEQVREVLPLWEHIAEHLRRWGYDTWCGILCAADYGVPQTRRRAILIASRARRVDRPVATHYDPRRGYGLFGAPWVSMAEALGWTGLDQPARTVCGDRAPRWAYGEGASYGTGRTLPGMVRTAQVSNRGKGPERRYERETDQPSPTVTGQVSRWDLVGEVAFRNGNRERSAVRPLVEPAPTIHFGDKHNKVEWVLDRPSTTVLGEPRISPPGHRDRAGGERQHVDSLKVAVVEAAILQSFRPDYPWQGNKTAQYTQVGNAVPPLLAEAVARVAAGVTR